MKRFPLLATLLCAAAGLWLGVAPSARAAVDTVTTTADSGPGSLRNTIAAAGSGDTIVFSSGLAGQTIDLTSGELFIGQSLTIDASALSGGIAINGGGNYRVLELAGANIAIIGLTVTNGYATDSGAGVLLDTSSCNLTASNCVFCGNWGPENGAAISTYGTLTLNNCTVTGNSATLYGGGLFGYGGVMTLNGCTISANGAEAGGGIESEFGPLTLNNCIVSNNVAALFGGGVDSDDEGTIALTNCVFQGNASGSAGALSSETPAAVSYCTFSDNISTNSMGGSGGGIVSYDTMTLNNCAFSGNSVSNSGVGGALVNSGTMTMNNSTISANSAADGSGGGIYNPGTLTASDCTWSGNAASAGWGGGIENSGILALDNCTLSDNSSINGDGGGIYTVTATNILVNCTICGNSVASGYGGGICNGGSSILALTNTIAAGNTATNNPDVYGSYSGLANFVGGNPELAALGNYGGPTPTMPPKPGSPVVDAGNNSVTNFLATDQRGFPRLLGPRVDIGAVEARYFVVLNTNDNGNGSLRATLTNSPDWVTFTNTLSGQTILLTSGELLVTNTTTIDASALPGGVIINGGGVFRVIQIAAATVTLNSLTLTNGYAGLGNGGGIENAGAVTLNRCTVSGNAAPNGSGGGIDYLYAAATLNDCAVSNNTAALGGGFYCYDGMLTLSNCIVSDNTASDGGAIDCGAAALTLNSCTFTTNSATNIGGAIDGGGLEGGTLEATNCLFIADSANSGGAMEWGGLGTLAQCAVSNNIARSAAGILNDYGTLTLNNCNLAVNTATNGGGGAISSGAFLTANNCTFSNNTGANGGAIVNSGEMTLNDSRFYSNSVTNGNGGGVYNYETLTVSNCNFLLNTAVNGNGGAIYNDFDYVSTLVLTGAAVSSNKAGGVGGGIANGGILTVNTSFISGNTATNGGGIFNALGMTLNNSTLCYNSVNSGNGGAIAGDSADAMYGDYATNFVVNCTICDNSAGSGGGIYNDSSSTLALTNTIVASNTATAGSDVYGVYFGVANFIGGNPQLAPEGNYGGTAPTLPPEFGSPVINAGTDWVTNFLATDQRGFPRLAGAHVDIGAVEAQIAPASKRPVLGNLSYLPGGFLRNGMFQFYFTNVANADFTVLTSTNVTLPLARWTVAGNATQSFFQAGQFYFDAIVPTQTALQNGQEIAIFNPQQYYRAVSP